MKIAIVPGDGIGVDVTAEAVKILERVNDAWGRSWALVIATRPAEGY